MSEYIPYNLWLIMSQKEQVYDIKESVFFQENKSAILMENKGRNAFTGKSININIRYCFVKERIDKGKAGVEYFPTYLVLSDNFTNHLWGKCLRSCGMS